eukprot:TRINITY_DN10162_c0_g1_i2.p1 TRINITY_DN10162_c0_g1~~TRINITY_DN10162_c0_g1_i2.p1  ORF type:complete len:337 (+),score=15.85 TRINITY_DN10162_c0_g1_i2:82-1011(+)
MLSPFRYWSLRHGSRRVGLLSSVLPHRLTAVRAFSEGTSPAPEQDGDGTEASSPDSSFIVSAVHKGVQTIQINRADKRNAITFDMYGEIVDALEAGRDSEAVRVTVLTGAGEFYSAGNDLSNFSKIDDVASMAAEAGVVLRRFVDAFIHYPKPLIAAVNGPAVGIPVTTLGLCDLVYSSNAATFHTPFAALGQSPEGCSSFLFPRILGPQRANEMLLLGRKFTARELESAGLISEVFPEDRFVECYKQRVAMLAQLPPESVQKSKWVIREPLLAQLNECNEAECRLLEERWQSEECANAIRAFFSRAKA